MFIACTKWENIDYNVIGKTTIVCDMISLSIIMNLPDHVFKIWNSQLPDRSVGVWGIRWLEELV